MSHHPSKRGESVTADRSRHSGRNGILRAVLTYLAIVYIVWFCYFAVGVAVGDIKAGDFIPGVFIAALFTTAIALIFVGLPTILGTALVLLLRPTLHPLWLALLAMLVVLGPEAYWWSRPSSDHSGIDPQLIAQALFLGYPLFRLLRPRSRP